MPEYYCIQASCRRRNSSIPASIPRRHRWSKVFVFMPNRFAKSLDFLGSAELKRTSRTLSRPMVQALSERPQLVAPDEFCDKGQSVRIGVLLQVASSQPWKQTASGRGGVPRERLRPAGSISASSSSPSRFQSFRSRL